jgi:hypothetical protein
LTSEPLALKVKLKFEGLPGIGVQSKVKSSPTKTVRTDALIVISDGGSVRKVEKIMVYTS